MRRLEGRHGFSDTRLPDGKIRSLSFLGVCRGGGRAGAIQGKEGIRFCTAKHIQSENLTIAIWQPCSYSVHAVLIG